MKCYRVRFQGGKRIGFVYLIQWADNRKLAWEGAAHQTSAKLMDIFVPAKMHVTRLKSREK